MTVDVESIKVVGAVIAVGALIWRQSSFQTEIREGIRTILTSIQKLEAADSSNAADIRDLRDRVTRLETRCDTNHDGE